jgi:hypothetical protein
LIDQEPSLFWSHWRTIEQETFETGPEEQKEQQIIHDYIEEQKHLQKLLTKASKAND